VAGSRWLDLLVLTPSAGVRAAVSPTSALTGSAA
jgi:hypothetical protein